MPEPGAVLTVTSTVEPTGHSHPLSRTPIRRLRRPSANPPRVPGQNRPQPAEIHLSYNQSFQNQESSDADDILESDVVSSLDFNRQGTFFAFGDKGGYVHVYKQDKSYNSPKYFPYISIKSHEPEFDYLKSIEIEEKISQLKWLPTGVSEFLLAANDRTIKLWKIGEQQVLDYGPSVTTPPGRLVFPRAVRKFSKPSTQLRKSYKNGHAFHINTVSVNNDQQTFLSSDDLRINLWHTERTDSSFVIVDIKPDTMDMLREVITTSAFHPKNCHVFMYSTSTGATNMCDMRVGALCDVAQRTYKEELGVKGFFSEVIGSITDAQFSHCGTSLATRDLMTVKIWDTRMGSTPVLTVPVHEYMRPNLSILYETDMIFDRFSVSWNHRDNRIVTGSYNDFFCIAEPNLLRSSFKSSIFQVSDEFKDAKHHVLKPVKGLASSTDKNNPAPEASINELELSKRCLNAQWHPSANVVAVASVNQVFLFTEKRIFNL